MSYTALLGQTVTIHTISPSGVDPYGNPVEVVSASTTTKARIEQLSADELTVERDTGVSMWRIFLLPSVVISELDQVIDDLGRVFQVTGDVNLDQKPIGLHHITALLRLITG